MGTWSPSLFANDLALDVRHEYGALLSVGKTPTEAEQILFDYYSNILDCGDLEEGIFWFSLAHSEWKKGLLSELVKAKALSFMERDLEAWNHPNNQKNYTRRKKVLSELKTKLLSPLPAPKKISKPTVHHCPWAVGSLLAYKIVTSEKIKDHSCFGKYALLRVIKINKHPFCKLAPSEYYDETMLVGLYGWIGNDIPGPDIVNKLEFIPIKSYCPPPIHPLDYPLFDKLSLESRSHIQKTLSDFFQGRTESCAQLDWLPTKCAAEVITCLDCDESFQEKIPEFFDTSITAYSMFSFLSFDITLAHQLEPYLKNYND
ncbi:MAG: hypothetical protein ACI3YK_02835 [Eubacteriales bacterium]